MNIDTVDDRLPADIEAAKAVHMLATGLEPNEITMSPQTMLKLRFWLVQFLPEPRPLLASEPTTLYGMRVKIDPLETA